MLNLIHLMFETGTSFQKLQGPSTAEFVIVNASARPPRLAGLPNVGTCSYRYTGIQVRYIDTVKSLLHTQ